jgi:hypothetical protein
LDRIEPLKPSFIWSSDDTPIVTILLILASIVQRPPEFRLKLIEAFENIIGFDVANTPVIALSRFMINAHYANVPAHQGKPIFLAMRAVR